MSKEADFIAARKKLLKAGQIAAKTLTYTCSLIQPDNLLLDIAEAGEKQIRDLGGQPAFPINISINDHAAHFTPCINDTHRVPDKALVKIDLGVHIHGFIADTARTVIVGGNEELHRLQKATDAGLQAAIKTIRAGIRVWDVSKAISKAIRRLKANPIENLTGHSIEQFNLHAGISVPSVTHSTNRIVSPRLTENMVVAIEPFSTYSSNPRVVDLEEGHIFGFIRGRNPRDTTLRKTFSLMKVKFAQLPFASRWLKEFLSPEQITPTLKALRKEGCIHNYPVLGLRDGSFIAQSEHTIIVERDGVTVTTFYQN